MVKEKRERRETSTGILAILGSPGLRKNFEIDETHGHEAEGEAGHQAGEDHQEHDYDDVDEEIGLAASVFDGHSIQSKLRPPGTEGALFWVEFCGIQRSGEVGLWRKFIFRNICKEKRGERGDYIGWCCNERRERENIRLWE